MSRYVIAQDHHDGYLLLSVAEGVLAFESKEAAEDFADTVDEPGEFVAIPYQSDMGPMLMVAS